MVAVVGALKTDRVSIMVVDTLTTDKPLVDDNVSHSGPLTMLATDRASVEVVDTLASGASVDDSVSCSGG